MTVSSNIQIDKRKNSRRGPQSRREETVKNLPKREGKGLWGDLIFSERGENEPSSEGTKGKSSHILIGENSMEEEFW